MQEWSPVSFALPMPFNQAEMESRAVILNVSVPEYVCSELALCVYVASRSRLLYIITVESTSWP